MICTSYLPRIKFSILNQVIRFCLLSIAVLTSKTKIKRFIIIGNTHSIQLQLATLCTHMRTGLENISIKDDTTGRSMGIGNPSLNPNPNMTHTDLNTAVLDREKNNLDSWLGGMLRNNFRQNQIRILGSVE